MNEITLDEIMRWWEIEFMPNLMESTPLGLYDFLCLDAIFELLEKHNKKMKEMKEIEEGIKQYKRGDVVPRRKGR